MSTKVLVLNAGSSTLKASVVDAEARPALSTLPFPPPLAAVVVPWGNDASREADVTGGIEMVLAELAARGQHPAGFAAVAHRVVHGGATLQGPAIVDGGVLAAIEALAPLAPLHNPVAAATIRAARHALGSQPHVAVFDTAFHATLPDAELRYPLPESWAGWGLRRYGFHGLSVAWSTERAARLLRRPVEDLRIVVAHLGSGCSVTAVAGWRSMATSMGMTPLEGLMMGTRAGSIDPGILLAVLRDGRRTPDQLADDLDHRAGLLGVSGRSADLRELQTASDSGDERAALAIAMFVDRAAAGIAAAATALDRLDGVVFTGGIGEHAGRVRGRIVGRLAVLGLPPVPPDESDQDRILGRGMTGPVVLRIEAREDVVAARATLAAVAAAR